MAHRGPLWCRRDVRTSGLVLLVIVGVAAPAGAQVWRDATPDCLGTTAGWTNKAEVADVDGDGLVDILLPNGGDYATPGTPEPVQIFRNLGTWQTPGVPHCADLTAQLGFTGLSRAIKAADVDGDGDLDLIMGGAWGTQLRLYLRDQGTWIDASDRLPQQVTSAGDFEFGDVDGDGDLDLVIADWGTGSPRTNAGGRTRLYLNDGSGHFTDATATNMPDVLVRWSWELTLADVDGDWHLDILVSSKSSPRSFVFHNDGTGHFIDLPDALPKFTNNYALEPMDIDGDGDLDLVTINDGPGGREHVFVNQGGTFVDETATRLTGDANPAEDDNVAAFLDVDADGDPDLLIGSLSGPDRLLINDGSGHFTLAPNAATPDDTPGTLGIALADLDGDGRLDVVQAQGEAAFEDKVQLASTLVAVDTVGPIIHVEALAGAGTLHARVHDNASPLRAHDLKRVWVSYHDAAGATHELELRWAGEYLWAATLPAFVDYTVCAQDRRGNQTCAAPVCPTCAPDGAGVDAPGGGGGAHAGGCCDAGGGVSSGALGLVLLGLRRRRRA